MQSRWEKTLATGSAELELTQDALVFTETFNGQVFGAQCRTADYLGQTSLEAQNVLARIKKKLGTEAEAEIEIAVRNLLNR